MTDGYEQYLKLFNRWIQEGLLDPDYATHDAKTFDAQVASGKAGAYVNSVGGGMGKFITATKEQNPEAKLTAVKFPVLNKGDEPSNRIQRIRLYPWSERKCNDGVQESGCGV